MKSILVPVDFSPVSRMVRQEARKFATLLKAQIVLVHVVRQPITVPDYPGFAADTTAMVQAAESAGRRHLAQWRRELEKAGFAVSERLLIGIPGLEIVDVAKRIQPEYIVMGSHGHGAFYEFVVGSTTRVVLRETPCPVVVVQSPPSTEFKTAQKKSKSSAEAAQD